MTPEVKQRIEQIQQGIVPKGYKKTKTDIVPADWKESPIGKYIREYNEKTTIPNQYPVLTSARTGLMLQTDYYSNRQVTTENNVGYNVLPYGYITFRSRSDDGRFRFNENRIIERGIISYFYPVFSFSEEVCNEYMLYLLNFSIYRRMYPYAEGTAQQVLSLKKLGQLKYSLPLVAEQKKIAEILSTQDKAIELQGRKIEELKRFKKGCLERMFPRKGQKVPEKRFPGFTDDWEQRKLSEIADKVTEKNAGLQYVETFTNSAEFGIISQRDFFDHDIAKLGSLDGYYIVKNEDFVYNPRISTSAPVGPINRNKLGRTGVMSPLYTVFRPHDIDTTYLEYFFKCGYWHSFMNFNGDSGARSDRFSIKDNVFFQMPIPIPHIDEQRKIGELLTRLDHLITLHQRKLEEMKRRKKALMQLLLMGIVRVKA